MEKAQWRFSNISAMVTLYLLFLLLNTGWQASLGVIGVYETVTALTIYLLPVVWYWYFRRVASEYEIRTVLVAIMLAGLAVGIYFAYDSYLKLGLGRVSAYANRAFEYSLQRSGADAMNANTVRIALGYRSFGLLETHSVSGAWVVLGALATLSLLPPNRRFVRGLTILIFGMMLFVGLNFTTIIAFALIVFLVEFGGIALMVGHVSSKLARNVVALGLIVFLSVSLALWLVGGDMSAVILRNLTFQKDLALGTGDPALTMAALVRSNFADYIGHVSANPVTLLLGDGFSDYGLPKGGDVGFIESLARFGLPFFLALTYGLFVLARSAVHQIGKGSALRSARLLRFALCVTLLIVVMDVHYSVWTSKSILPIMFFALALYDRYLVHRALARVTNKTPFEPPRAMKTLDR